MSISKLYFEDELKKINANETKTLDTLITEKATNTDSLINNVKTVTNNTYTQSQQANSLLDTLKSSARNKKITTIVSGVWSSISEKTFTGCGTITFWGYRLNTLIIDGVNISNISIDTTFAIYFENSVSFTTFSSERTYYLVQA